jgi:hypothetical protein
MIASLYAQSARPIIGVAENMAPQKDNPSEGGARAAFVTEKSLQLPVVLLRIKRISRISQPLKKRVKMVSISILQKCKKCFLNSNHAISK